MGHATLFTSPGAKERQQSCRLILDFISTQHFMDVFMSLIRTVIYQQSVFSQHNILQTSVTHIQSANEGRRRNFSWECCDRAGWPAAGSRPFPDRGCGSSRYPLLHRYRHAHLPRNQGGSKPLVSNLFTQLCYQRYG